MGTPEQIIERQIWSPGHRDPDATAPSPGRESVGLRNMGLDHVSGHAG